MAGITNFVPGIREYLGKLHYNKKYILAKNRLFYMVHSILNALYPSFNLILKTFLQSTVFSFYNLGNQYTVGIVFSHFTEKETNFARIT